MSAEQNSGPEAVVKEIRRQTRRKFTAEEKIRIVLEGLKGEASIAELCRREGIVVNLYYRWSKDFLEAGKKRLTFAIFREWFDIEAHSVVRDVGGDDLVVEDE